MSKAQSEFGSYIQKYSSYAKSDNNNYESGKQRSPRSRCTTPEPIFDNKRQIERKQSNHQLCSSKYLHPDQPSPHSSRNIRTSPEPSSKNEVRCCKCGQTGHFTSECPQHNDQSQPNSQFPQFQHQSQQPPFDQRQVLNFSKSMNKNYPDSYHDHSYSSWNKSKTLDSNINNDILNNKFINRSPQEYQQSYSVCSQYDKLEQNYSRSTPRNHQNQSHSLKNKRAKSEQNINQSYQKSQLNHQLQQSQQPFFIKSKNKHTTPEPSTKNNNQNHKREQNEHFKKDNQQFRDQSHQKPKQSQQSQQNGPSPTVIVNFVPSQKAPKQEPALCVRLVKKKSDLTNGRGFS